MNKTDHFSGHDFEGIHISPDVCVKLDEYVELIMRYRNRLSLVGAKNRTDIIDNLIIPSIISTVLLSHVNSTVLEIGSGSGVLGIVTTLVTQNVTLIICERNLKKIAFLHEAIIKLDINNVIIVDKSLEHVSNDIIVDVDYVLIRGIKLVDIYDVLVEKFPRGTKVVYFGSDKDVAAVSAVVKRKLEMPGNDRRVKPLHIYLLEIG